MTQQEPGGVVFARVTACRTTLVMHDELLTRSRARAGQGLLCPTAHEQLAAVPPNAREQTQATGRQPDSRRAYASPQ